MEPDINTKILYAGDQSLVLTDVRNMLISKYENVFVAKDGNEGFKLFQEETPDVIITDLKMPISDGIGMIKKIREINKTVPIIMALEFDEVTKLDSLNIFGYLIKPMTRFGLLTMVEDALLQNEINK